MLKIFQAILSLIIMFSATISYSEVSLSEIIDKYRNNDHINDAIIKEVLTILNKPGCAVYIAATKYDSESKSINIISANIEKNSKTLYVFSTEERLKNYIKQEEVPVMAIKGEFLMNFADSGGFDKVIIDNKIALKGEVPSLMLTFMSCTEIFYRENFRRI